MFKSNVEQGAEDQFEEILSVDSFKSLFNKSFFKNLIKIIDNPPSSLKIKYFAENGKYSVLMKQLVTTASNTLKCILILFQQHQRLIVLSNINNNNTTIIQDRQ